MSISKTQFNEMLLRLERNNTRQPDVKRSDGDLPSESALHEFIRQFCDSQWPRWKVVHARMDRPSTIAVGAQDFTIFLPLGKVLCIECKRKGKKRTVEQAAWALEMERLGHQVHLVTSVDEFMGVVKEVLS